MSSHSNVNKVILVGNLGASPELRHTAKGSAVVNLAIATNRALKQEDGTWKETTVWHRAVVWGKRAEVCHKYLEKGNRVYVEGVLQTNNWKDKDGQSHWKTEVLVDDIKFLSSRPRNETDRSDAEGEYPEAEALAQ